jgi:hypothetical protein
MSGLERTNVTTVVRLPAGGYLASGVGSSNDPHVYDPYPFWRSVDGRVWERTVVSGPSHFQWADSGPLGIVAIDAGEAWWSPDGVRWIKGDLRIPYEPGVLDMAVGDRAALVVSDGAWASTDGRHWKPVTGERVESSRVYGVEATEDGFIAVGAEWIGSREEFPDGDFEARVWRISPDGATWRPDGSSL